LKTLEEVIGQKKSTKTAAAIIKHYEEWCRENGVYGYPVIYDTIAGYLAHKVLSLNGSTKSIDAVKTAIKNDSLAKGHEWLDEGSRIKLRRFVAETKFEDVNPIRRVSLIQIKELREWLDGKYLEDNRVLQLVLLLYMGHDGLFRVGELLSGLNHQRNQFDVWLGR